MKRGRVATIALAASLATWGACAVGGPIARAPSPPPAEPSLGPSGAGESSALPVYEEGLLRLDTLRPAMASAAPVLPDAIARGVALDHLRRGLAAATAGDASAAVRAYDQAREALPVFADWADLLAARELASSRAVAEVDGRVARIPAEGAGEWAWRSLHEALLAVGDSARAVTVAEAAGAGAQTAAERAFAWARAGRVRAARRDTDGALRAFRTAMREGPSTPGGLDAARGAHDLPALTPEDRLQIGRILLANGGTERGLPMVEAYLRAPSTPAGDRAAVSLEIGRRLFDARSYDAAERHLAAAAASSPEAAFLLGRTRYRMGRQEDGVRGFQSVARSSPGTAAAADALFLLGDLAHDDGRLSSAAEYYRQAVGTGAHTVAAVDAAVRLAGMALITGDAGAARADLERYLSGRPRDATSAPAIYWMGRAQLAAGDSERARESFTAVRALDPFSYYGMLAAKRLGVPVRLTELGPPPRPDPQVAGAVELAFFRIDLLRELGLAAESDLELARLQERFVNEPPVLYEIAEGLTRHGQPVAGALLGRRVQQTTGVWDERLLRIVFQFPYREIVEREARRQGLDPYIVAGLIRQESLFNPIATSPAGAIGLMQVMPATGTGLARRGGVTGFQAPMLRDPATNLRLGTIYLADQMARWDGRLSDVFSAYNAGPNRVDRWRTFREHADDEIYIERIPLAETRDYVKRVTLYSEIYRLLYGSNR